MAQEKYVFGPFEHRCPRDFSRAHLEFYGINHFRPTFTAHVYFNDATVTPKNASEKRQTYAGKFALLGHERCYGDAGHCDVPTTHRRFDDRPSHPLTPAFRRVEVTDALKRAIKKGKKLTVTVVVKSRRPFEPTDEQKKRGHAQRLFDIKGMQLVTFV